VSYFTFAYGAGEMFAEAGAGCARLVRQGELRKASTEMSDLRCFVTAVLLVASQSVAETAPAPAEGPGPLSKRIPCDAFKKQDDGSWTPTRDVNVELPDGNVLTVGSAASFRSGNPIRGFDLAAVLERECRPG
jgi:hypothetical protein